MCVTVEGGGGGVAPDLVGFLRWFGLYLAHTNNLIHWSQVYNIQVAKTTMGQLIQDNPYRTIYHG